MDSKGAREAFKPPSQEWGIIVKYVKEMALNFEVIYYTFDKYVLSFNHPPCLFWTKYFLKVELKKSVYDLKESLIAENCLGFFLCRQRI